VAVPGCSSDTESVATISPTAVATTAASTAPPETSAASTVAAATVVPTTVADTTPVDPASAELQEVVETLASDDFAGRDNGTPGSRAAQDFLIAQLSEFAEPLTGAAGPDAYRQSFDVGTNLLAVIPGSDLADQYVIVGAHYDHLGSVCAGSSSADSICNGATDNATGVAAALALGRSIAAEEQAPRRSVVIALWDAEEDGLLGSAAYLANPVVPIAQTVAYVNFDMQGTNISPSLRNVTVLVGAETGGPSLVASAVAAAAGSTLDTVRLSLLFGQGRSDHANFVNARVPTVFFTDATPPCYHTVQDDASIVDYAKLQQQLVTSGALVRDLMNTDTLPAFDPNAPGATYEDAVAIHDLLLQAQPDFLRFSEPGRAESDQFVTDLGAIVDAGPNAFDDAAIGRLLTGTIAIVELWSSGECDGFLD
jgi:Peptidase family M28